MEKVDGTFRYLIAGTYTGGDIPDGLALYEFPDLLWAKFPCTGPMPHALQSVNTRIFSEWLPNNPSYEVDFPANIEWYGCSDNSSPDYQSAIWVPVRKK